MARTPASPGGLHPLGTNAAGLVLSGLIAYLAGAFAGWVFIDYIGIGREWHYVFFWPTFCVVAAVFFVGGLQDRIPIGWVGVPDLFGTRIPFFDFAEGVPWALPFGMMGHTPVDMHLQTNNADDNPPIKVEAMSKDGVMMTALIVMQYYIEDPFLSLSVGGPVAAIKALVETQVRKVFALHDSAELMSADVKDLVASEIKKEVDKHDKDLGFEVKQVLEPEILPPKEIMDAHAKKVKEKIEGDAEATETEKLMERATPFMGAGKLSASRAFDVVQTESGKVKTERVIHQFDGLEPIAAAITTLGQGLASALKK